MRAGLIRSKYIVVAFVFLMASGLVSCGGGSGGSGQGGDNPVGGGGGKGGTVTVLAASSLTDAFGELAKTFEKQNPGTKVKTNFGASSDLLAQLQQGASADVFASADTEKIDTAKKDGLVSGKPQVFVKNREVVMVPKDNPANIKSFQDLDKSGIKLVLAQKDVPAAEYAKEILDKANSEYGGGFEKDVLSNLVSRESDVRASVNRVVVGDADATFGYASDYTPDIRDKVKVIPIPKGLNIIATYPIVTLKDSKSPDLAKKWVDLVVSKKGQSVLKKWGFEPAA